MAANIHTKTHIITDSLKIELPSLLVARPYWLHFREPKLVQLNCNKSIIKISGSVRMIDPKTGHIPR